MRLILFSLTFLLIVVAGCASTPPDVPTPPDAVVPVVTPSASPAAPPHPLSIAALRARPFAPGEVTLESELEPGENYRRYIASYRSDGLKIYALLTVPDAPKPPTGYPVVIFNHGYIPPDQYRTTERYVAYVDAFARNGYIVFKSDYRGHGSSEGNPASAYTEAAYVIDVLNATAAMRAYPDADPARIGMWGHSMGGYITLRAMVTDPTIRAGVIWAGVVATYPELLQSWFRRGRQTWRDRMFAEYGTPEQNPAFWAGLSANSYLHELSGPVQIHHGTADADVPYAYSVQLDEQMRAVGAPVELFLYEGDDHNIAQNREDALTLSVVFFNQHVKGSYD